MIKIYISDTAALDNCEVFEYYKNMVDDTRKSKIEKCRNEEDKKRSLLAGYLIQVGVREWIGEESGLQNAMPLSLAYTYGENGKPYLMNVGNLHFSLSHSGSYVVAAFSEHEVGIDIQHHKPMKEKIAERFFSQEDNALLKQLEATGDGEGFYRIWAIKEAYMKLTGEGLRQGLHTTMLEKGRIVRKNGSGGAFFKSFDELEHYSIAVCSESEISDIESREVEL